MGYTELLRVALYDLNKEDIVMVKKFQDTNEGIFLLIKKKLLSLN